MPRTYTAAEVSVIGFTCLIFLVVTLLFGRACEWSAWTPRQLVGWGEGVNGYFSSLAEQHPSRVSWEKKWTISSVPGSRELWRPWAASRPKCVNVEQSVEMNEFGLCKRFQRSSCGLCMLFKSIAYIVLWCICGISLGLHRGETLHAFIHVMKMRFSYSEKTDYFFQKLLPIIYLWLNVK